MMYNKIRGSLPLYHWIKDIIVGLIHVLLNDIR
jgi:hypothetical protein